jgi:hypothetical protein
MVTGAFPVAGGPLKFGVALYRGTTQLSWTQEKMLILPGPPGSGRERAVYGPAVVEVAPHLWRMFFAGDDHFVVDPLSGQSAIWSAVSSDRVNWQFEGEVLRLPQGGACYPSVIGDMIYYLQCQPWADSRLAAARIRQ